MTPDSRRKGARGELEVVRILHQHGYPKARRTHDGRAQLERGDIANGPPGYHLEVKLGRSVSIPRAIRQAAADAAATEIPVVVHREDHGTWNATLPLDELLALIQHRERA